MQNKSTFQSTRRITSHHGLLCLMQACVKQVVIHLYQLRALIVTLNITYRGIVSLCHSQFDKTIKIALDWRMFFDAIALTYTDKWQVIDGLNINNNNSS